MTRLGLFNVWVADDEIAGAVQNTLQTDYGPTGHNLRFSCFRMALTASQTAARASFADDLPDVAVIDLNFNENDDAELIRGDHIQDDTELKGIITTTKNQLGFLVAAEIKAASVRTGKRAPDIQLYTAKPDIKEKIGWAAAPSKYSGESFLNVSFKNQVQSAEIVHTLEEMLWKVAERRLKEEVLDLDILQALFDLRDFILSVARSNDVSRSRTAVVESGTRLAEAILSVSIRPQLPFPYAELRLADKPELVAQALNRGDKAQQSDYEAAGIGSQYRDVRTLLMRLEELEDPEADPVVAFCKGWSQELRSRISCFFPAIGKQVNPYTEPGGNRRRKLDSQQLNKDVEAAIKLAAQGDYHWALCRTLKYVKKDGNSYPETAIAAACHSRWSEPELAHTRVEFNEARLQAELDLISLPAEVKEHLNTRPRDVPELDSLGLGDLQTRCRSIFMDQREGWQHPWTKLKDLQSNGFEVSIADDLAKPERQHLTDWAFFFFGQDSFVNRLRSQIPTAVTIKNSVVEVAPGDDEEQVRITFKLVLDKPLLSLPTGGLKSVLASLRLWGSSAWTATIGTPENASLWAFNIWPDGQRAVEVANSTIDPAAAEYYFSINWTINDYLLKRTSQ